MHLAGTAQTRPTGLLHVGIADLSLPAVPWEIDPAGDQELTEGIEERQAAELLNKEELAHLVDLEEHVAAIGGDDEIEAPKNKPEPRHQGLAAIEQTGGSLEGLHLEFVVRLAPVGPAFRRRLRN